MDENGPEWFAPKRFGFGIGRPIRWQGWVVTLVFTGILIGATLKWRHRPDVLLAILVPVFVTFCVITARTTRGGWRWRWGEDN